MKEAGPRYAVTSPRAYYWHGIRELQPEFLAREFAPFVRRNC